MDPRATLKTHPICSDSFFFVFSFFFRRHAATLCSPFILLYGLALCCLQYVWAMDLQAELPATIGSMSLRQLGLDRAQYPCLRLGAMVRHGVSVRALRTIT